MTNNYSAWEININDFASLSTDKDRYDFIIRFAVLAPSSHNTQPWQFFTDPNTEQVHIDPQPARLLNASDPNGRLLSFSLGCALENFSIAADYFGYSTIITIDAMKFRSGLVDPSKHFISIKLNKISPIKSNTDHLIFSIPKRRSNRVSYSNKMPPQEFLTAILKNSNSETELKLLSDTGKKKSLAKILLDMRMELFSNKEFRAELASYKRTNFTQSYTGMPGFTMGFNNMSSLFASMFIRFFNVIKPMRQAEEKLLAEETPVLCFIASTAHSPNDWVNMGRSMMHIMLLAENAGLSTSINALPPASIHLQEILHMKNYPQMLLRIGYGTRTLRHSPRFPASKVITSIQKISHA